MGVNSLLLEVEKFSTGDRLRGIMVAVVMLLATSTQYLPGTRTKNERNLDVLVCFGRRP